MSTTSIHKAILIFLLLPAVVLAQEWRVVPSGAAATLKDVQFVNKQIGYIVGEWSSMLKTTDGGATWLPLSPPAEVNINAVSFTDELNGWIAADGVIGRQGDMYHSTDGGVTWAGAGNHRGTQDIQFITKDTGWAVGYMHRVYRTTNGGIDWIDKSEGLWGVFTSCSFINGMEGWVAGATSYFDNFEDEVIWHTADGGETWEFQDSPNRTGPLNKIHVLPSGYGFAYGWGQGMRTTNFGQNWEPMGPGNQVTALYALDERHIYLSRNDGSSTTVKMSNDTGQTWMNMNVEAPQFTKGIFLLDENFGSMTGAAGKIWMFDTTTVGIETVAPAPEDFRIAAVYPNPSGNRSVNGSTVTIEIENGFYEDSPALELVDILGRTIGMMQRTAHAAGSARYTFDVSNLPTGMYYVRASKAGVNKRLSVKPILIMN